MATMIVDYLVIMFMVLFLANLLIQLLSLSRLILFTAKKIWLRILLHLTLLPLSVMYCVEVYAMLIYYWGSPALLMTNQSFNIDMEKEIFEAPN